LTVLGPPPVEGYRMDYHLENLGPEEFQEVCQALLVREFPKTQCFPVGQADGGRDAVSYHMPVSANAFVVFQVKFVREPSRVDEPHKWLAATLKEELPKVRRLIPKGAKEYFLLTNVRGTGHSESGSIDVVQATLTDVLEIPGYCWWRDDINRRLDDAFDIKWAHPGILTGADVLRQIVEAGLNEDKERRTSAIRAFIRDQYEHERQVRFRQIELHNGLFDLFVDVPILIPPAGDKSHHEDLKTDQAHELLRYLVPFPVT
jgi:hypothetical protein